MSFLSYLILIIRIIIVPNGITRVGHILWTLYLMSPAYEHESNIKKQGPRFKIGRVIGLERKGCRFDLQLLSPHFSKY